MRKRKLAYLTRHLRVRYRPVRCNQSDTIKFTTPNLVNVFFWHHNVTGAGFLIKKKSCYVHID
jgi:hypothetical protein